MAQAKRAKAPGPRDEQLLALGRLNYLATYCPLHRQFPAQGLSRLFVPAINHGCVRFFENENGAVAAALIWARLSDSVSERMVFDRVPPRPEDWTSGENLWFLDILAPFGHGKVVARHIARTPPSEPFYFARLGKGGLVRKVVRGNGAKRASKRVSAFQIDLSGQRSG